MLDYIPHKNNVHSWKTVLFIFLVILFSASLAYYIAVSPKKIHENVVSAQVAETLPVKTEKEVDQSVEIKTESIAQETTLLLSAAPELIPVVTIAKVERNKDPKTKLQEAKDYAKPQILSGKYIDISLKYQNMVIFENGSVVDAYQISSGKKGMNTPIGTFKVENKSPRAWSKSYGLWMPNWMAFLPSGQMGIHELPIWPGGYQEGANHLGTPVSHGCVRLGVGAAKRVYDWAEIGTPIIIHQ
ncbi:MAG: L,D-transpeptidase [bacterium]